MTRQVIDEELVRRLVSAQFEKWADLSVRPISPGGWDNRIFRLGEHMIVRLPSAAEYSAQVEKENHWLPRLAPSLPLQIPTPLAMGAPTKEYPWRWSIYRWIDGETASPDRIDDVRAFATSLAAFINALHRIDAAPGPLPGPHNFHRGGPLASYDAETRRAIQILRHKIHGESAIEIWDAALRTTWRMPPVWVHGDVSPGNLLLQAGRLNAVIDFGMLGVGDPACDLSIAWTLLQGESRKVFRETLQLDSDTWARGRAWALWKALIVAANLGKTNASEFSQPLSVIEQILEDRAG